MADRFMQAIIAEDCDKFNPMVVDGVSWTQTKDIISHLEDVAGAAFSSLDPEIGIKFVGLRRATPEETYAQATAVRSSKRKVEFAKSSMVLVYINTTFHGELVSRPMWVSYTDCYGGTFISGSKYYTTPVLTEWISSQPDSVFVRVLRDKLTFRRLPDFYVNKNGESTRYVLPTIRLYKKEIARDHTDVRAMLVLPHYMLCKFGYTQMFEQFGSCVPIAGYNEINPETYPPDKWTIYQAVKYQGQRFNTKLITAPPLKMVIPNEHATPLMEQLISGVLYIGSVFPVDTDKAVHMFDSLEYWKGLFGYILLTRQWSITRLLQDVNPHISSLDEYMDALVVKKLKDAGVKAHTIYELFIYVMLNYTPMTRSATQRVNNMYGAELAVLYYLLQPINNAIFQLIFTLMSMHIRYKQSEAERLKGGPPQINPAEPITLVRYTKLMQTMLRTGRQYEIRRDHPGVGTVSYPGDNALPKIGLALSRVTAKGGRKSKVVPPASTLVFHPSIIEAGHFIAVTKANMDGTGRLNPYVYTEGTRIMPRPGSDRIALAWDQANRKEDA